MMDKVFEIAERTKEEVIIPDCKITYLEYVPDGSYGSYYLVQLKYNNIDIYANVSKRSSTFHHLASYEEGDEIMICGKIKSIKNHNSITMSYFNIM